MTLTTASNFTFRSSLTSNTCFLPLPLGRHDVFSMSFPLQDPSRQYVLEDKGGGDFQVSNTVGQFIRALAPSNLQTEKQKRGDKVSLMKFASLDIL